MFPPDYTRADRALFWVCVFVVGFLAAFIILG